MSWKPLPRLRLWLALGWLAIGVILVLSLAPLPQIPGAPQQSDKVEHFLAYVLLMLWYGQLGADVRTNLGVALGLSAFGGGVEILQSLTPHRSAEWGDLWADLAGIGAGLALVRTRAGRILERWDRVQARS